jgi:hypothetical protein
MPCSTLLPAVLSSVVLPWTMTPTPITLHGANMQAYGCLHLGLRVLKTMGACKHPVHGRHS